MVSVPFCISVDIVCSFNIVGSLTSSVPLSNGSFQAFYTDYVAGDRFTPNLLISPVGNPDTPCHMFCLPCHT